jgi:DNA-binding NarL/FixJ family response regulator
VPLRLLIVDDHAGFRRLARRVLGAEGVDVVGAVGDGRSALRAVEQLGPDAVLLDVLLPDLDGFEVARCLAAMAQPPRVVLTSSRTAEELGDRLRQAAAVGFIAKDDLSGAALVQVLTGDAR